MRRTITITQTEFHALIDAIAEYDAAWGDTDDLHVRAVLRAQQRIIDKWHAAGERRRTRKTSSSSR